MPGVVLETRPTTPLFLKPVTIVMSGTARKSREQRNHSQPLSRLIEGDTMEFWHSATDQQALQPADLCLHGSRSS